MDKKAVVLTVGYANAIEMAPPDGVTVELPDPTTIVIKGADKQKVGQFAAEVRGVPQAGAVQGQGHPLRKRTGAPQGRQVLRQRRLKLDFDCRFRLRISRNVPAVSAIVICNRQ